MDKRQTYRVPLIPPCKARFEWCGRSYSGITVADVGVNGCCIHAPLRWSDDFIEFPLLERWEFISPSLPKGSTRAQVVWIAPQDGMPGGGMDMGIQFLHPPAGFTNLLFRFVTLRSSPGVRPWH